MSVVYGKLTVVGRKPLWDTLQRLALDMGLPCRVMGDFNSFLSPDDKHGCLPITPYQVQDFQNYVPLASMEDLTYTSFLYTWTNGLICSKLDHVVINKLWLTSEFTPPGCLSNHSICLVSIFEEGSHIPKLFKFFNIWDKHETFSQLVDTKWIAYKQQVRQGTGQFMTRPNLEVAEN